MVCAGFRALSMMRMYLAQFSALLASMDTYDAAKSVIFILENVLAARLSR